MNSSNPNKKNRRVLIIDDAPSIHDDFRKILSPSENKPSALSLTETQLFGQPLNEERQIRFEIDSAYQGQEGAAMVQKALSEGRPYAMAFVDMRMPPGWDGVKTTREIWQIDSEIQIVICTAYSEYSWQEIFEIASQNDRTLVLKKPFATTEALQLAKELTEKWTAVHFNSKKETIQSD
jgi:CheY-like chemotaxis protein